MSIFGSKEDDPLLQNDPLAPSSNEEPSDEDPSSDERPGAESSSRREPPADAEPESVFSRSEPSPLSEVASSPDTRTIVYSLDETLNGSLTELNAAIDQGWRLVRVNLRPSNAPADDFPAESPSMEFSLRQ